MTPQGIASVSECLSTGGGGAGVQAYRRCGGVGFMMELRGVVSGAGAGAVVVRKSRVMVGGGLISGGFACVGAEYHT